MSKEDLKNIMKKKQNKNDHHFVPQVYIKQFYDSNIQEVWRASVKHKKIKHYSSAQIFYAHKLYDLKLFKQRFTDIEDYYSELEDQIGKIYQILNGVTTLKPFEEVKTNQYLFFFIKTVIITQYFRTKDISPNMLKEYCTNLVTAYESKEKYLKKEFSFIKIEELRELEKLIKRGVRKDKKYVNELIKGLQYSVLPILLSDYSKPGIKLIRHSKEKYISSDKPVVCKNTHDILNFRNFLYALTPNILIYSLGEDVTEELINDESKINKFIFDNAVEFIISHDKSLIENIISLES
ncbi:DUF4238 domain-containing protein [Pantoea ananatis]|uniref:DUF4238 domain-containing protein n=1 Tax=Pantoea ananas TaxID=553 RepID=UPI001576BAAF|nr:DUF4238 domain-containing protein [Pantoea ananatis]